VLAGVGAAVGAGLAAWALPPALRKALVATLADPPRTGPRDIRHIVILMQENRSFDHYFGMMPGVRGFADPERLERAGISWKVYQQEDNFDNNALAWFLQYLTARRSSPLYHRGMVKGPAGAFEDDARHDRLPQVSWLVAPAAQSEHSSFLPAAGAEYIAQKVDAIAANPDVWAKTVFILSYDENDGMFDHVPPPTPPPGTPGEFIAGQPIGLGFRIPATIVSLWTAGGRICSEVFDHASLIRLIESRFGVREPNITAWRRRTCGDLTSAFRFSARPARFPRHDPQLRLAAAEAGLLIAQRETPARSSPWSTSRSQSRFRSAAP
jgi:phospholipase C